MFMHFATITIDYNFDLFKCFFYFLKSVVVAKVDVCDKDINESIEMRMKFSCEIERWFATWLIAKEYKNFICDDTSFFDFNFYFDFDNFIDKSLSIHFHFHFYFYEIVVRDQKICDEWVVNINEIVHEMKIHLLNTKSVFVMYCSKIVVESA